MSIVNQMLKDLNARAANPHHNVQDETFSPKAKHQVNPLTKYRIATGCFVISAIILTTYTLTTQNINDLEHTPTAKAPVTKETQATSVNASPALLVATEQAVIATTIDAVKPVTAAVTTLVPPSMTVSQVAEQLTLSASSVAQPISPSSMKINTSNGEIRFVAGLQDQARLALQSNDMPKAIQALQALLAAKPFDHASRLLLARLYYQTGQPDVALNLLQVAPNEDELSIEFLSFRGSLFTEASEHRYAIDDYKVLSRLEPNNVRWQLGIAIAHDQLNDYADAKFAYEQVKLISDLPTNVNTFVAERISILKDLI